MYNATTKTGDDDKTMIFIGGPWDGREQSIEGPCRRVAVFDESSVPICCRRVSYYTHDTLRIADYEVEFYRHESLHGECVFWRIVEYVISNKEKILNGPHSIVRGCKTTDKED